MHRDNFAEKIFEPGSDGLTAVLGFVEERLKEYGVGNKERIKARFELEDIVSELIRKADEDSRIRVRVNHSYFNTTVRIWCKGRYIDYKKSLRKVFSGDVDEEAEGIILANLFKSHENDLKIGYKYGINKITLIAAQQKPNRLMISAAAMLCGLFAGLIIKVLCNETTSLFLANSVFDTGTALFLRAIKMVIAYLVFFSIASGFSEYRDLKEIGKVFGVTLSVFFATSVVTILVAYGLFRIFPVGSEALRRISDTSIRIGTMETAFSAKEAVLGLVPENFIKAFLDADMIQLLVLAVLTGIAVAAMDRYGSLVSHALSSMDELFQKITLIIVKFMPVCIFCSMTSMVIKLQAEEMAQLAGWIGLTYLCDGVVIILLLLFVALAGKTSPARFLRQMGSLMPSSYALASSNAVMPFTIETCRDKLKISPRIYSFSIPLGIIANKDGSCVTLLISTLFLARVYNVRIEGMLLISLFFSVFMLSIAAPAVSGGLLLCLTALLPSMGIPIEGVSILMGMYFLVAMVDTMTNVTSTVAVSYVVDKWVQR